MSANRHLHPDQIDFSRCGRAAAGVKHSYAILYAENAVDRGTPVGTREMAETLICDQRTARERAGHLVGLGLLHAETGTSIYNGDPEDRPTFYRLLGGRSPKSETPQRTPTNYLSTISSLYSTRYIRSLQQRSRWLTLHVVRGIGPSAFHPDEDRWRANQYGPVGWLMTQTSLAEFTANEMAEAVGLGVTRKAVLRVLRLMVDKDDAEPAPGRGRYRLTLAPWVLAEDYEPAMSVDPHAPEEHEAAVMFQRRMRVANEEARQASELRLADQRTGHAERTTEPWEPPVGSRLPEWLVPSRDGPPPIDPSEERRGPRPTSSRDF